jgi:nucleoside phosphorylase
MRILIVAATDAEVSGLVRKVGPGRPQQRRLAEYSYAGHDVHVLVTGVGMVATAAWCSRTLAERSFDFALDVGLCGSFDRALTPGRVVHVVADCFAELGAEDGGRFLTLRELGLEAASAARNSGTRRRPRSSRSNCCRRCEASPSTPFTVMRPRLPRSSRGFSRRSRAWKGPRSCTPA